MRRMPRSVRSRVAAVFTAALLVVVGCGNRGGDEHLPDAAELLPAAADEMADVATTRMVVEAGDGLTALSVRRVEGTLIRSGDAEGTAQIEQLGALVEISFRVVEDTFYYQLLGGWQTLPLSQASTLYDPSAILDPDRGVPYLLRAATDGVVEARDEHSGVAVYRVKATLPGEALGTLLPGVSESVPGTLWIGVERPLLYRAEVALGGANGSEGIATVTLSDFDASVEISAP